MRDLKNYLANLTKPIETDFGTQEDAVFTVNAMSFMQFGNSADERSINLEVIGFPSKEVANKDGRRLPLGNGDSFFHSVKGNAYDAEIFKRPLTQLVITNAQKEIMREIVTGTDTTDPENPIEIRFLEDAQEMPLPDLFLAFQEQIDSVMSAFYELEHAMADAIAQSLAKQSAEKEGK